MGAVSVCAQDGGGACDRPERSKALETLERHKAHPNQK